MQDGPASSQSLPNSAMIVSRICVPRVSQLGTWNGCRKVERTDYQLSRNRYSSQERVSVNIRPSDTKRNTGPLKFVASIRTLPPFMMEMVTKDQIWGTLSVVVFTVVASAIFLKGLELVKHFLLEPLRLKRVMAKQGLKGPPFRPVFGNIPEIFQFRQKYPEDLALDDYDSARIISPHYAKYIPIYGRRFLYWWGTQTMVVVTEPELVKEILATQMKSFSKSELEVHVVSQIIGLGLNNVEGEKWALYRRTLNPAFHLEALKGMVGSMVKGAAPVLDKWEQMVSDAGSPVEIDVGSDLHIISGQIIAHAAFGGSYEQGKQVFEDMSALVSALSEAFFSPTSLIPGLRFLPTAHNRKVAQLKSRIESTLKNVIQSRYDMIRQDEHASGYGQDLLGRMLTAAAENNEETAANSGTNIKFDSTAVLNNCKVFYFAGKDTTANLLSWTMLMLATHPEWQEQARNEVLEVCAQGKDVDASMLNRLKVVGMILYETVRLFTIAPTLWRMANKDLQLGDLFIPKGLGLEIAVHEIHRDPKLWGDDVMTFNPGRFANGVANACSHPLAFMPFSYGPRYCIGQNFALMEAKIVVAMVLQRFQVSLSPNYRHRPDFLLVQRPKYGMQVILKTLSSSS